MCALRTQIAVELEPDMQHISLASHTSLVAHVRIALAPQACQVEFELLEDMQQQNTYQLDKTSGSLYCVQRDCAT